MKKIKVILASVMLCAMAYSGYTVYEKVTMSDAERALLENVEALTNREGGSGNWEGKRLKMVDCRCSDGKSGKTLHCEPDGTLEPCTATQQGSKACYKVGLSGMKLC